MFPAHGALLFILLAVWALPRAWSRPATSVALSFGVLCVDAYNRSTVPVLAEWRLAQVLNVLVVALACTQRLRQPGGVRDALAGSRITAGLLAFFAYALVAILWTATPAAAWTQWLSFSKYVAVFVLGAHIAVRNSDDLREALREVALVWTPYLVVVLFLGSWGARGVVSRIPTDHAWEGFGAGEVGFLAMPTVAAVCVLTLPLLREVPAWLRSLGIVLMFALIARSGARGQLVACVLAAAVYLPERTLRRVVTAAARGAILVALGFAVALWIDRGEHSQLLLRWTLEKLGSGVEIRMDYISTLWAAFSRGGPFVWLFGLGTNASTDIIGIHPHFVPAQLLCEFGCAGVALFGWALALAFRCATRSVLSTSRRDADVAWAALLVFFALIAMKSGSVLNSAWLWTCIALTDSLRRAHPWCR